MAPRFKQLALAAALALIPLSGAQADDWVRLGTKKVDHRGDRDVILVTGLRGTFRSIKLRVSQRGVRIASLKIHFGNGETQDVALRRDFTAGAESRVIDLPGGKRVINKIDLVYATLGKPRGPRAIVEVFGIRSEAGGPKVPDAPVEWVSLATKQVSFAKEKDVVPVTGVQGRFRAVQLRFMKRKVRINDLKIFFGNGESYDVSILKEFQPGQWTRIIDLPGGARVINRIELVYRTRGLPVGAKGLVEVRGIRVAGTGAPAPAPKPAAPAREWKQLGSRLVRPRLEKDVIPVTVLQGTFKRVKLVVRKKDVFLVSATIKFANGESHLVQVNQLIASGRETAAADLPGAARIIKSVELVYRSKGRGQAVIELWGK